MKTDDIKVSLDSRLIKPGEYFAAIKGETFDGHKFIDAALKNGAAGIIEESELYELAKKKINRVKPKIIGVTGSSGKTSLTSFLFQVLSYEFNVCLGSLNTKLGLSVNVINDMREDCQIFVAEMGMDRKGEIAETALLFTPDIAVITTINHVHVEKLGNMKNLVSAKGEILDKLKPKGKAFLNSENKYTKFLGNKCKKQIIWFDSKPLLNYPSKILGNHNIRNFNVCTLICKELGLDDKQILHAIKKVKLPKGRLNVIEGINGSQIIDDTYNANPESVSLSLDVLREFPAKRRICILGDMLELGKFSVKDHQNIGKLISEKNVDIYVGVGIKQKETYKALKLNKLKRFIIPDSESFSSLNLVPNKDDVILVKGSQGMRMEKIVKKLMKNPKLASKLLVRQDVRWK